MEQIFWSDKQITASISNKAAVNTGIASVDISGLNGISCGSYLIDESTSTNGTDLSNVEPHDTTTTTVKFYLSPTDMTKTSATGAVQIRLKWKGLLPDDPSDDRDSPYYQINDIIVRNAVDSVYTDSNSYEVGVGETLNISYTLRGENHNGTYLPVYDHTVTATIAEIENSVRSISNDVYAFTSDSAGTYTLTLKAEGAYLKPEKVVSIIVKELWLKLGLGSLNSSKLDGMIVTYGDISLSGDIAYADVEYSGGSVNVNNSIIPTQNVTYKGENTNYDFGTQSITDIYPAYSLLNPIDSNVSINAINGKIIYNQVNSGAEKILLGTVVATYDKNGKTSSKNCNVYQAYPDMVGYSLTADGSHYINSGVIPTSNTRVVMDFTNNATTTNCIFGSRTANGASDCFCVFIVKSSGTYYVQSNYSSTLKKITPSSVAANTKFDKNKNVTTAFETTVTHTTATFSGTYPMPILSINTGGTVDTRCASGTLYSCKIYENGVLIRDFIPWCRGSLSANGLMDTLTNQFYPLLSV